MKQKNSRYFILAIAGALIIGVGVFIFFNSYFEKVEIVVAAADLAKGEVPGESDLELIPYYKETLPDGYISDIKSAAGKRLMVERRKGDPVTSGSFSKSGDKNLSANLSGDEVLLGLVLQNDEPVIREIASGSRIAIVSTQKEKDLEVKTGGVSVPEEPGYLQNAPDLSVRSITSNISISNGQLLVSSLEVVEILKSRSSSNLSISIGKEQVTNIYIKCNLLQATVISRIIKDGNFKILLEKS